MIQLPQRQSKGPQRRQSLRQVLILVPLVGRTIHKHRIDIELFDKLFRETRKIEMLIRLPVLKAHDKQVQMRSRRAVSENLQIGRTI